MARPRRSHETRERLLEEGMKVLREQGYHGTGIKEVLDRVKVPKGSFYNYFASKEQFGAEVIRHYTAGLLARMDAALGNAELDGLEALRRYYEAAIALYEEQSTWEGCLLCNLGAEIGGSSPQGSDAVCAALTGQHERLSRALARAQASGSVRRDVPAADLAHGLLDAWNGALIRMKSRQSVEPLRQFRALFLDRLLKS